MEIPNSFYYEKSVIITGMVTGSFSCLSSFVILSIIFRSTTQLRSVYHRIITWISVADICTSVSLALATLPMPENQPYPFQMPSYGNITTCKAQGLTYFIGNCFVFWFNGLLNIYYLCSLGFNLNERKIINFVEIPLTIIGIVCCTALPMIVLPATVNPGPLNIHCASYEPPCEDGKECNQDGKMNFIISYTSTLALGFTTLMVCMSFITFKFYSNQRKLKKVEEKSRSEEQPVPDQQVIGLQSEELIETLKYSQKTARIITIQALMYILAFNCVWIFGFMEFLLAETPLNGSRSFRDALALLRMVFQPSQGTFNVLIFVYHKVHALRQSDEDMPYFEALRIVLFRPDILDETPQIISNFNLVVEDVYTESKRWMVDVELRRMARKPSLGAEDVISSQDMDVKNASIGRISINDNSSNIQPSHRGLSSLVGFGSNLESEVSHDVDVDRGHTPSVTDSAHNSFDDVELDNDISYANETRISNDDNLSFKTFFSKLSRKKADSAVENRSSSAPKLDNFEDHSFDL